MSSDNSCSSKKVGEIEMEYLPLGSYLHELRLRPADFFDVDFM